MFFGKRASQDQPVQEPGHMSSALLNSSDADIIEIAASGLFDGEWYLRHYRDIAEAGIDPLLHYVTLGAAEGRQPGPRFDVTWYLGETPEADTPGTNPILHYLRHGRALGRTPKALDEGQAFDSFLAATRAGRLPFAEQVRAGVDHVHYAIKPAAALPDGQSLPLPPLELSIRIGSPTLEGFEEIGRSLKQAIVRCLPDGFEFRGSRCSTLVVASVG